MATTKPVGLPPLLKYAQPGTYVTVDKLPHGGSLQARMLSTQGIQFYWRYSHGGHTHREPVGVYDPAAPPKKLEPTARGFSVAAARERCRELALEHQKHRDDGGLREAKNMERERKAKAREQQRASEAAAAEAAAERAKHSLGALLEEYVRLQQSKGRISAREAHNLFELHVVSAWPTIARGSGVRADAGAGGGHAAAAGGDGQGPHVEQAAHLPAGGLPVRARRARVGVDPGRLQNLRRDDQPGGDDAARRPVRQRGQAAAVVGRVAHLLAAD